MSKKIRLGPKDAAKLSQLALTSRRKHVLLRERATPADPREELRRRKALLKYEKHLRQSYDLILGAVLRAVATAQAVSDVNADLENRFGMPGVSVDSAKIQVAALEVLQVEIAESLLSKSPISAKAKQELTTRIVGRLVPLRDGAPSPTPYPTKVSRETRVEDLERVIKKEMRRSYPPKTKVELRGRVDE